MVNHVDILLLYVLLYLVCPLMCGCEGFLLGIFSVSFTYILPVILKSSKLPVIVIALRYRNAFGLLDVDNFFRWCRQEDVNDECLCLMNDGKSRCNFLYWMFVSNIGECRHLNWLLENKAVYVANSAKRQLSETTTQLNDNSAKRHLSETTTQRKRSTPNIFVAVNENFLSDFIVCPDGNDERMNVVMISSQLFKFIILDSQLAHFILPVWISQQSIGNLISAMLGTLKKNIFFV